jgi:hypothetical protein
MTDIISAILAINPNAKVSVNADDLDQITWHNGTTPISKADIEAKQAELQTAYDANKYQRDREKEYLSKLGNWQNQLDMIYHDIDNWKSEVKKIKDANPKE